MEGITLDALPNGGVNAVEKGEWMDGGGVDRGEQLKWMDGGGVNRGEQRKWMDGNGQAHIYRPISTINRSLPLTARLTFYIQRA